MRFQTIDDVIAANNASGQGWFDAATMNIVQSKIETALYDGRLFVTSELRRGSSIRTYTIRVVATNGFISPYSAEGHYASLQEAVKAIEDVLKYNDSVPPCNHTYCCDEDGHVDMCLLEYSDID